jgi:hypothetical protein
MEMNRSEKRRVAADAPALRSMIEQGILAMKKTLEAASNAA